jgi:hypothetical protein
MRKFLFTAWILIGTLILSGAELWAASERFRAMWRDDPATTMVIGWDQISGLDPIFFYDDKDHGTNISAYTRSKRPDHIVPAKGMNNHFVRLSGLRPNTAYYFVVRDSEGLSRRLSFHTAPNDPNKRLSIIAGGDSRNHRNARRHANIAVRKLRPHFIMFGGDFTGGDTAQEWIDWFDDWQESIGSDGRLFPIVVTRGNHEFSNRTLIELFDTPNADLYYAFSFGGDLLRVYTLNSLIPSGGAQRHWLENDLYAHQHVTWKFAQYHHPMRPHTSRKPKKDELWMQWAPLFHQYRVQLAVECDAHVAKKTWPMRPSNEPGSHEGFIRDDEAGTVYIGEGCWGAPLRPNDNDKPWTRASGSFNHFSWIFVDSRRVEIRTVKTDGADQIDEIDPRHPFEPPRGLVLWNPPGGDVVFIPSGNPGPPATPPLALRGAGPEEVAVAAVAAPAPDVIPRLIPDVASGEVQMLIQPPQAGNVAVKIYDQARMQVLRHDYAGMSVGKHIKTFSVNHLPPGEYIVLVESGGKLIKRYQLLKRF